MKKLLIALLALAVLVPAKAQMTPEAVMGMTPDLPSAAALLNHWKEYNDPDRQEAPDSDIVDEFQEKWRETQEQIQEMQAKTLKPGMQRNVMSGKVAGTNMTAQQAAGMSEADAKALAMSMVAGKTKAAKAGMTGLTSKDIEAMSHMTDEQRAAYMQESGLGESITAKMNANKGKQAANKKQYQLVTEMTTLAQKEYALQQKALGMISSARDEGYALFDRKYRKTHEALSAEIASLVGPAEEDRAAAARLAAAITAQFKNMYKFYSEYIPMYRDAVVGAMDCCRAQLLPVKNQRKDVMEKLYGLTQSAEYALYAPVPFEASSLYFELSEKIVDFELEFEW